ncbi:MAG: S8 family serine peptidase, partial [Bacteroidetes bacterium]|nr:S8 family serine peptidase [Bacteroidota bacterium]
VPNNKYIEEDGTSMASPVVAGLAALIRSYYPKLTAVQVKDIIMKSVVKINHDVTVVDGGTTKEVPFSDLCLSGGIVNAYNALKMAESISKNL